MARLECDDHDDRNYTFNDNCQVENSTYTYSRKVRMWWWYLHIHSNVPIDTMARSLRQYLILLHIRTTFRKRSIDSALEHVEDLISRHRDIQRETWTQLLAVHYVLSVSGSTAFSCVVIRRSSSFMNWFIFVRWWWRHLSSFSTRIYPACKAGITLYMFTMIW